MWSKSRWGAFIGSVEIPDNIEKSICDMGRYVHFYRQIDNFFEMDDE